jgi:hypothetical protein
MRTTIDIEDDVLAAAKEMARRQHVSAGQIVSRLLREALQGGGKRTSAVSEGAKPVGGFRPFPAAETVITDEQIDALRDAEGV